MREIISLALMLGLLLPEGLARRAGPRGRSAPLLRGASQITFGSVSEGDPAVSPNGEWMAFEFFHARPEGAEGIWVMPIKAGFVRARPLVDNANNSMGPSWSPDDRWISFVRGTFNGQAITDQVCKVDLQTGRAVQLTHLPKFAVTGDSAVWLRGNRIAFKYKGGIYTVRSDGGRATRLFDVESRLPRNHDFSGLAFSPNEQRVAFEVTDSNADYRLAIVDLRTGKLEYPVGKAFSGFPAWINNHWLLYSGKSGGRQVGIWALSVLTGKVEQLTKGPIDFNPTFSAALGAIFISRNEKHHLLYGFHIWRVSVPRSMIERWFHGN